MSGASGLRQKVGNLSAYSYYDELIAHLRLVSAGTKGVLQITQIVANSADDAPFCFVFLLVAAAWYVLSPKRQDAVFGLT